MGFVKRENHINTLESPSSISITQLRNENRRRRLEQVLDQPGLKVEDVVVAVGDKEVEEQIKKLEQSKAALEEDRLERMGVKEMQELRRELHVRPQPDAEEGLVAAAS